MEFTMSPNSNSTKSEDVELNYEEKNLKIFVGGLNYITQTDDLRTYFKTLGKVTSCIIIMNEKGKSRCYGFLTFEDDNEENLNKINKKIFSRKHEVNGKIIDVRAWVNTPKEEVPKVVKNKVTEFNQNKNSNMNNMYNNYNQILLQNYNIFRKNLLLMD